MSDASNKIIPPQHDGGKKDIEHRVEAGEINDARKLFFVARNRLLDVNHWHEYASPISGKFQIVDGEGREVDRTAEMGDYLRIDIPAPDNEEGHGFDWVKIEAIEDESDSTGPNEKIAFRVRPSASPTDPAHHAAHFFNEEATSTFVVERNDREVKAAVYGRNEVPNTDADNTKDKIRNTLVGLGAMLGASNVQWGNLVKGLIVMKKEP